MHVSTSSRKPLPELPSANRPNGSVVTVVAKDAKGNRKVVTKTVTLKPKLVKKPL